MSATRLDGVPGLAGTGAVPDRSDYGGSRAPTGMANATTVAIDGDDSRLERGIDR
ncbi:MULTISPECIES: hypothetical protein [Halorubrum]|uniref:hypothetical protein n=1 Tax=Halorubrum TaxID=56688 RepID=UPI0013046D36|nr:MULTISPECIES: hypothetical protein [Halorubrum]